MYVGVILVFQICWKWNPCIPHVCGGDPKMLKVTKDKMIVFPMYVGVILGVGFVVAIWFSIPHVCGGDPYEPCCTDIALMYSPCMWG